MTFKKSPTTLAVFDFDGTLVDTPMPDTIVDGITVKQFYDDYLRDSGQPPRKWQGWWGRIETLTPPVFGKWQENELCPPEELLNSSLAEIVKNKFDDESSLCVLMTGRHIKMTNPKKKEHICKTILEAYGLSFDRYYFTSTGEPTIKFKI